MESQEELEEIKNQFQERIETIAQRNQIVKKTLERVDLSKLFNLNEYNIVSSFDKAVWMAELFRGEYIKENSKINQLYQQLDVRKGEIYEHFRFDDSRKLNKTEVEKYFIPRDEKVIKIKEEINQREFLSEQYKALHELFRRLNRNYRTIAKEGLL